MASTGKEAEHFHALARSVEPRTAEPSEQLLRPVCRERQSHGEPKQKNPDIHTAPPVARWYTTRLLMHEQMITKTLFDPRCEFSHQRSEVARFALGQRTEQIALGLLLDPPALL